MTITVDFDTADNCAKFAAASNTTISTGATSVSIGWEKLAVAKAATGATGFVQDSTAVEHFIIKGTVSDPALNVTVVEDLGNGFLHITTDKGLAVANVVTSLDPVTISSVSFSGVSSLTSVDADSAVDPTGAAGQWARIRISSQYRPLLSSFTLSDNFNVKSTPELYIVDSGVNWSHPEFSDVTATQDLWKLPALADFSDEIGHGTMVASAAVGKNLGVGKNVKVINVKIAGTGVMPTTLELGQALDAILANATANPNLTRVVNISWGVPKNAWLEHKFQQLLDAGITVVAAAGNSGVDVANITPAGITGAITVGAIDRYDIPAGFNNISPSDSGLISNYGQKLDVFAPGDQVVVATKSGSYTTTSGTSFAAGYVSGTLAQQAAYFANIRTATDNVRLVADTPTVDALLFEDNRFSENQNKLIYFVANDTKGTNNLDMYLGCLDYATETIAGSFTSAINVGKLTFLDANDTVTYGIEYEDAGDEAAYSQFLNLNSATGDFTVTRPTVSLPAGQKIKMIRFRPKAVSGVATIYGSWVFYFATDPDNSEAVTDDLTLALTQTSSISFFGYWSGCVAVESFLPLAEPELVRDRPLRQAYQLQVGHQMSLADHNFESETGTVDAVAIEYQPCVRLATKTGVSLVCSTSAPIPTREGNYRVPVQLLGQEVPVSVNGVNYWDKVTSVDDVGHKLVSVLTVGNRCFWAGERDGAYVLHHNAKFLTMFSTVLK